MMIAKAAGWTLGRVLLTVAVGTAWALPAGLAIGLGVLYKQRTGSIAVSMLVIYVGLAVVIAAIKSALAGA